MEKLKERALGIRTLEELAGRNSPVHSLHPLAKLLTTAVFIVVVLSSEWGRPGSLLLYSLYPGIMMAWAGIPLSLLMKRLAVAVPFVFFAGLSNLFYETETALYLDHLAISYGLLHFLSVLLKTLLTVSAVLILIGTTPMTELAWQLHRLKVPSVLIMQIMLTYRYIGVLLSEASSMYNGYRLRSGAARGVRLKQIGPFCGRLLLTSLDRAERVSAAMNLRGFDGVCRFTRSDHASTKDYVFFVSVSAAMLFIRCQF